MSRREDNINRKLEQEKAQIRSILADFRKSKYKCVSYTQQLNKQFTNRIQFEAIEKEVSMKLDLLDLQGLQQLKGRLVKSLEKLLDLQNELNIEKQRMSAKIQHEKINSINKVEQKQRNGSIRAEERVENKIQKKKQEIASPQNSMKTKSYNIPFYHIQPGTCQRKIQRMTNFVASLRSNQQKEVGNMNIQAENMKADYFKQILMEDPDFKNIKYELEKVKKEKEELEKQLKTIAQKAIQDYIKTLEVVEECQYYKVLKIYKTEEEVKKWKQEILNSETSLEAKTKISSIFGSSNKDIFKSKSESMTHSCEIPFFNEDRISFKQNNSRRMKLDDLKQQLEKYRSKRKQEEINNFEKQLEVATFNVEQVVMRVSNTLQNNEKRLRKLRENRAKMQEKEREVWNQLEQI